MSVFGMDDVVTNNMAIVDELGVYLDDCQIKRPSKWAFDPVKAERLWRLSEELVGEKYGYGKESRL